MTATTLLDVETMFDRLMSEASPTGVTAIQDVQPESYDEVPFVSWSALNNGQYAHELWSVTLVLNVIAEPTEMYDVCAGLYAAIAEWSTTPSGVVAGVGGVLEATDSRVFSKINETFIHGKHLAQYTGTFSVSVRQLR